MLQRSLNISVLPKSKAHFERCAESGLRITWARNVVDICKMRIHFDFFYSLGHGSHSHFCSLFNIWRLGCVIDFSVMLAAKFYDDQYYNNAYYGKVGGVPCKGTPTVLYCTNDYVFITNA